MSLKSEMNINDYINVIKRKLTIVVIFFVIAFVITVSYALYLPPVYESTGTILIKSQEVQPADVNQKFAAERFEAMKKIVLTNEALVNLAKKYKLFELDETTPVSSEAMVEISKIMRLKTKVELLQVDSGGWGRKDSIAFQVTANLDSPEKTFNVANDLIKMFMTENESASQAKALETAEFFGREAEAKKKLLEGIENEIADFKRTHANALPQSLNVQATTLDRLDADLRASQREQSIAESELRSLEISLESARSGLDMDTGTTGTVVESELDRLKAELAKQSLIYSDSHPSIRALDRKIKALEDKEAVSGPVAAAPKLTKNQSALVSKLEAQVDAAKARVKSLEREQAAIRDRINRTQGLVFQGAQSEGVLGALERKYETAKDDYTQAKAKYDNAKLEKSIQLEHKGERFELVEAPILPETPIKPNRILLIALGFVASLVGAAGIAVLIEALDGKVRGLDNIAEIIKLQPMATIPYIKNEVDHVQVKYEFYNIAYFVFSVVVLVLIIVHFFVMPLDEVAGKMYGGI